MESVAVWFQETLLPYGHWGILALSFLDSSFVPMPGFIDLVVMAACALQPERAFAYGTAAVVGSSAGTMVVFAIARGGRLATTVSGPRLAWAEDFLKRRGAVALLIAAVLPAPFPLKVVIIAAGYLRQPLLNATMGIAAGRTLRFGTMSALAAIYGPAIIAQAQQHAPLAGLIIAVLILAGAFFCYRWRAKAFG